MSIVKMGITKKIIKRIIEKKNSLLWRFLEKEIKYIPINTGSYAKKNIIFTLPALRYPCGGNIVTHSHSDAINLMQYKNFQSQILYPSQPSFSPSLFKHQSDIRRNLNLDPKKDFVVLTEVQVLRNASKLFEAGISYAINVQNGYLMNLEMKSGIGDFKMLQRAYENAAFIISMSKDTTECIELIFPACSNKIIPSFYVIDKATFKPLQEKQNIICYMPRKLAIHTQMFLFFLGDKLPENWKLQAIDGVSEEEVYRILSESKIFLSFSEFEGLAMPPVMAALSGNYVIGYTGEGNKEYFHLPCFSEVECGNLKDFVQKLLSAISRFDREEHQIDKQAIEVLANQFSKAMQIQFLKNLVDIVDKKIS
jgi:hypothetical protein